VTDGRMRLERSLRAAAEVEPAAARATGAVLETLLGASDDGASPSWDESPLSRDGYPVEIGVVPGVPGLRYTVELPSPADPGRPAGSRNTPLGRVERTLAALRRLGAAVPALRPGTGPHGEDGDETVLDLLRRTQRSAPEALRYGAWLSGRHAPGANRATPATGRFKLYLEVPSETEALWRPWERTLFDRNLPLPTRAVTLRMVGVELAPATKSTESVRSADVDWTANTDGRIELYYDLSSLNPTEVALLAERAGLGERAPEILELLRRAVCLPLRHELPARYDWGFSTALDVSPDGSARPRAFTLYTFANALFGGDGKIRRALLALGEAEAWDLSLYEHISRPLAERRGFVTCHGVFGVTLTGDPRRPAVATWGLAPPPAAAATGATKVSEKERPAAAAVGGRP